MIPVAYPRDPKDPEWLWLEPLIPAATPGGRPRAVNLRQRRNGIFYVLKEGIHW